jgi:hypothetical protein
VKQSVQTSPTSSVSLLITGLLPRDYASPWDMPIVANPPMPRPHPGAKAKAHRKRPWPERFIEKVLADAVTGCWDFCSRPHGNTYGRFMFGVGDGRYAHRLAYELWIGPIPSGLEIDHLCRNRRCVRPAHLEAVTRAVNNARSDSRSARNARKTLCGYGHPFSPANTRFNRKGQRRCVTCGNARGSVANAKVSAATAARGYKNVQLVQAFGDTKSIAAWSQDPRCCVGYNTLRSRIQRGWGPGPAIVTAAVNVGRYDRN